MLVPLSPLRAETGEGVSATFVGQPCPVLAVRGGVQEFLLEVVVEVAVRPGFTDRPVLPKCDFEDSVEFKLMPRTLEPPASTLYAQGTVSCGEA